jgi:hypothetical protein
MKKILFLMVALMLVAGVVSASTILEGCSLGAPPTETSTSGPISVSVMCAPFASVVATLLSEGYYLNDLDLEFTNTYSTGVNTGTNTFSFVYSGFSASWAPVAGTGYAAGAWTETVSGGVVASSWSPGGPYFIAAYDTTPSTFAAIEAGGTIGNAAVSGGTLDVNGHADAAVYISIDYSNSVPEPMSMMLVGGGLLGLGLLTSKLRKKA